MPYSKGMVVKCLSVLYVSSFFMLVPLVASQFFAISTMLRLDRKLLRPDSEDENDSPSFNAPVAEAA